jgi:hypothetical protein
MFIGNILGFIVLFYLAAGAGMLFPTDCAPPTTMEGCSAIHRDAATPVFITFWTVIAANVVALVVLFRPRR